MCKCNTFEKKWLNVVRWIVFSLMLTLLLVVIVMVINQWCGCYLCELILSSRILRYALVGLFSLTTLWVAIYTLRIAQKTSEKNVSANEMTSIVALRKLFYQEGNLRIHQLITQKGFNFFPKEENDKENDKTSIEITIDDTTNKSSISLLKNDMSQIQCDLNNYIGTLEVAYLMVEKEIIGMEEFKNLFGYRLLELYDNQSIKTYISYNLEWHIILNKAKVALDAYMSNIH